MRRISLLYAEQLVREPGDKAVYSDLNAILLGSLLENLSGLPLERLVAREVFEPLGLSASSYHLSAAARRQSVPTAVWRGQPVQGQVNDPNAAMLGGAAGHAGIFTRPEWIWLAMPRYGCATGWAPAGHG